MPVAEPAEPKGGDGVAGQSRWGWVAQFLGLLLPVLLLLKLVTGQWFPPGSLPIGVIVVAIVEALRRRRQPDKMQAPSGPEETPR